MHRETQMLMDPYHRPTSPVSYTSSPRYSCSCGCGTIIIIGLLIYIIHLLGILVSGNAG